MFRSLAIWCSTESYTNCSWGKLREHSNLWLIVNCDLIGCHMLAGRACTQLVHAPREGPCHAVMALHAHACHWHGIGHVSGCTGKCHLEISKSQLNFNLNPGLCPSSQAPEQIHSYKSPAKQLKTARNSKNKYKNK